MEIFLRIILCMDVIMKSFIYGWVILIPLIVIIIGLIIKMKRIKNSSNFDKIKLNIGYIIIGVLCCSLLCMMSTSRMWGPNFYKYIIGFSINGKQIEIEEKLEKKYNKNFTFIEQDEIKITDYAGNTLGQNKNGDDSIV